METVLLPDLVQMEVYWLQSNERNTLIFKFYLHVQIAYFLSFKIISMYNEIFIISKAVYFKTILI